MLTISSSLYPTCPPLQLTHANGQPFGSRRPMRNTGSGDTYCTWGAAVALPSYYAFATLEQMCQGRPGQGHSGQAAPTHARQAQATGRNASLPHGCLVFLLPRRWRAHSVLFLPRNTLTKCAPRSDKCLRRVHAGLMNPEGRGGTQSSSMHYMLRRC